MLNIAEPSIQSLFIVPMYNGRKLGQGTGFVVQYGGIPYLITNYHIAVGRDPNDGQPMHGSGAAPDVLEVMQMIPAGGGARSWQPRKERVLEVGTERALWLHHPIYGRSVDVVALPLQNAGGAELHPYDICDQAPNLRIGPAEGVSIVGFPFGYTGGSGFAIWTRGFIASEPDVDLNGLPRFLIDARTRRGQSGSPVIAYNTNGVNPVQGGVSFSSRPVIQLLGIYSGRINEESDLGYVWKVRTIEEILLAQEPGKSGL